MDKKAGFLQEDNGSNSSMRLMSALSLVAAICVAGYGMYANKASTFEITGLFLAGAFAPKAIQKRFEEKLPPLRGVNIPPPEAYVPLKEPKLDDRGV